MRHLGVWLAAICAAHAVPHIQQLQAREILPPGAQWGKPSTDGKPVAHGLSCLSIRPSPNELAKKYQVDFDMDSLMKTLTPQLQTDLLYCWCLGRRVSAGRLASEGPGRSGDVELIAPG